MCIEARLWGPIVSYILRRVGGGSDEISLALKPFSLSGLQQREWTFGILHRTHWQCGNLKETISNQSMKRLPYPMFLVELSIARTWTSLNVCPHNGTVYWQVMQTLKSLLFLTLNSVC